MSLSIAVLRGPSSMAPRITKEASKIARVSRGHVTERLIHQSATRNAFFTSRTAPLASSAARPTSKATSGLVSRLASTTRRYNQQAQAHPAPGQTSILRKLFIGGVVFGGTLVAVNVVFNRETRDDGGMPVYEREYLNNTFLHTGLGIGIIGLTARQMVQSGFVYRLMMTNPWVVAIGGLGLSIATMMGTRAISPDNYIPKYALWTAFNVTQAAVISPLIAFLPGALLARAGLYTVAMMGSISVVGATAKQEKYLYIGGPLLAGAALVLASGFAPLIIPATAVRTLAFTENVWLWGGLAVFGGFTLYDVQKVLHHARMAERGLMVRDPINESISLELDFLNIFIRMAQILAMQSNRRK